MGSPERAESLPVEPTYLWTSKDDDLLLQLKWSDENLTWKEIADRFPRRTQDSCSTRYARILADMWDEKGKKRLATLYDSHKEKMWQKIAEEMNVPWIEAEQNHWRLGKEEMDNRAGVPDFRETWQRDFVASENDNDSNLAPPPVDDANVSAHEDQGRTRSGEYLLWSGEEETSLLNQREAGKNWGEISTLLPRRSAHGCKLRDDRLRKRPAGWGPELQTDLCRLYRVHKSEMWAEFEKQLAVPWQSAEAMHWILGWHGIRERLKSQIPTDCRTGRPRRQPA
ncbi:hypothetical protein E4U32_005712 [Claviceps aff. humidiphila group G2b]|nr:hypothetical protein E4U32_005712 [Claviceps aff. humidiphila group G2b]